MVYSDDYSRSALVWYALQLMGYEASIYTWEDWKAQVWGRSVKDRRLVQLRAGEDAVGSKYTKLGTT